MFQNPEIALDELPGTELLDWQNLHPNYKRCLRTQQTVGILIVLAAITTAMILFNIPLLKAGLLLSIVAVPSAVLLVWPAFSVPRRGYVVRDKDIVFRSGVVWRSVTAIPFNRIQHVETSSTPLDRRFKIATLKLFTAGGSSGDLKIDGLGKDVAEQLRFFVLEKVRTSIESA